MLKDEIWTRICEQCPRDVLCEPCIRERFAHAYHRQLRIDDLYPCPINVSCGHYRELLDEPPRLLADWARAVFEANDLPTEIYLGWTGAA
jgi:hypothetical protein